MIENLDVQIDYRIGQLKDESKLTWQLIGEGLGLSAAGLHNKIKRGHWRVEDLMEVAEFFKVPLMYFVVPEDQVDEILGRKPPKTDDEIYEEHRAEIRAAKLESEVRARDRRIDELENKLKDMEGQLTETKSAPVETAEPKGYEIAAKQLRLSIKLCEAVADLWEGDHGQD